MSIAATHDFGRRGNAEAAVPSESVERLAALGGAATVCLVATAGYLFTLAQWGYYGDDFSGRARVVEHGWPGAYLFYARQYGFFRPLGVLHLDAWLRWFWAWPATQHAILLAWYVGVCLLLYALVRRLADDTRVALAAAAVFAAWHTCTESVVWISAAAEMLPAGALLLASALLYLRHLEAADPAARRRRWWLSLLLFVLSALFHDQHLGAAVLFSSLALLKGAQGRRARLALGTLPFWAVSIGVGVVGVITTAGTVRPLEPGLSTLARSSGAVVALFVHWMVAQTMADQWLHRWGAPGAFYALDRDGLILAVATTLAGCGLVWSYLRRDPVRRCPVRRAAGPAVIGLLLAAATLGIMASRGPGMATRHTLFPAMGVAMVVGAALCRVPGRLGRHAAAAAVTVLVFALSMLRLGYVYEWTIRTRVTDRLLPSLAAICPAPSPNDLLVIDGVDRYGRGFQDSWGLSAAFSMDRGVRVRIATVAHIDNGRLLAKAAWDNPGDPWPIDADSTRFFVWEESRRGVRASSLAEYLRRHPDLALAQSSSALQPESTPSPAAHRRSLRGRHAPAESVAIARCRRDEQRKSSRPADEPARARERTAAGRGAGRAGFREETLQ